MRIEHLGGHGAKHAIVACVHGDETCGWHAYNRLKYESGAEFLKPVKFILANERAFEVGRRFCEVDLNRVMPGDPAGERHEDRVAARLTTELEGLRVIDIHATESKENPFAIVVGRTEAKMQLVRATGLDPVIDMSLLGGGLTQNVDGVVIECGYKDDESAADTAYQILLNFLAAEGVIAGSPSLSTPSVYEAYEVVAGTGYEFLRRNFELVRKGEVFATKGDRVKKADEDFYPVLMSTRGYHDIIGFKARKVE